MPKRTDIQSILIIGAGPIIIGQACEFDYSGVQACKALREEGYRVILINSNPATIMTDPATADVTYIEPITWQTVEKIIAKEKPDAILPTMGGQTALNCALDLWHNGVLAKYTGAATGKPVELIGATPEAIDKAEDRLKFKDAMTKIGLGSARSGIAHSMAEAWDVQKTLGFPTVIRPSFTLGGTGGGIAYNPEEFEVICKRGLEASPTNELLIEESLLGWKEYEMEVVRDKADNCIIVCSIENLDPMGVHTGDSITVAPAQTLTDKEYQILRNASLAVLREIGVDTGGSNVQFSINPAYGRMVVIEMNPRVSRSSALASKATGFPIAKIAAKLAVGFTLDELRNDITGGATPASFEPSIDYVVTKIPRFAFEKFPAADSRLTTQMKSVGEVMAMGRTFQESFQKALRGLEVGVDGLNEKTQDREVLEKELGEPGPERIWYVGDAFAQGMSVDEVFALTKIDRWFLVQIEQIVKIELEIERLPQPASGTAFDKIDAATLRSLKQKGFSDRRLARQFNLGTGGQNFRGTGDLGRCGIGQRLRLIQIALRQTGPDQTAISARILRLLRQNGGKGFGGIIHSPLGQHFFGCRQCLGQPAVIATQRHQLFNEFLDLGPRDRTLEPIHRLALVKGIDRRDRLDAQLLRQAGRAVHVDLDQLDLALGRRHRRLQRGGQRPAGPAPCGPEIHDHWRGLAGFNHIRHEGGFGAILDHVGRGGSLFYGSEHRILIRQNDLLLYARGGVKGQGEVTAFARPLQQLSCIKPLANHGDPLKTVPHED